MATPTVGGLKAAVIEHGRILDVDIDTYTVAVTTQFSRKPHTGISFATPYQHFYNGEGIYFMPEVGSLCWICYPSDGNKPFVMGWAPASEEGNFKSNKMDLNPGDIYLGTRDDNFLALRRGGVIQLSSGPLCQRLFLPINNTIRDFCENYGLHTLGGDLEWTIGRSETDKDGKRPANLTLSARQFANDPEPIAVLEMGSHEGNDKRILSLKIKDSPDGESVISLSGDNEGNLVWECAKDVTWTVKGDFSVTTEGGFSVSATGDYEVEAAAVSVKAKTGGIDIESTKGSVNIKAASLVKIDPVVQAGGSTPTVLAPPLLTWLATHVHNLTIIAPGSPTTPPTIPLPPSIISKTLFAG